MAKLKSEVAPKGMYFKPTEFMLGDKYYTIMTVVSYPRSIFPGYLTDLTGIAGVRLAIKHIPISFEILIKIVSFTVNLPDLIPSLTYSAILSIFLKYFNSSIDILNHSFRVTYLYYITLLKK